MGRDLMGGAGRLIIGVAVGMSRITCRITTGLINFTFTNVRNKVHVKVGPDVSNRSARLGSVAVTAPTRVNILNTRGPATVERMVETVLTSGAVMESNRTGRGRVRDRGRDRDRLTAEEVTREGNLRLVPLICNR